MTKVKISLTIDQAVLDRVDEAAWRSRRSRSAYVEDLLDGSSPPLPLNPYRGEVQPDPKVKR